MIVAAGKRAHHSSVGEGGEEEKVIEGVDRGLKYSRRSSSDCKVFRACSPTKLGSCFIPQRKKQHIHAVVGFSNQEDRVTVNLQNVPVPENIF